MSDTEGHLSGPAPRHGQIGYLQIPTLEVARSAVFYQSVFGWKVDLSTASFEAPGMIGQWVTDRAANSTLGPVVWIYVDQIAPTLKLALAHGVSCKAHRNLTTANAGSKTRTATPSSSPAPMAKHLSRSPPGAWSEAFCLG